MTEKESFNIRLALLRKVRAISQEELGAHLGLTKSAISSFEKGKSFPNPENLLKLARHFNVSVDYLLTGKASIVDKDLIDEWSPEEIRQFFSSYKAPAPDKEEPIVPYMKAERGGKLEVITVQVGPDGEENIEVVNTRAAAGYARHRVEQEYIANLPSFRLPGPLYSQGSFRAFQVSGDSMEPTLQDGDWLICRAVENWGRDMRDNRVYVVVTEEDVLVKRVINQFNERGQITLQSDNRGYGVRFLDGSLVGEVWEGVARLTRNLAGPRVDVPDELARHRADIAELFDRLSRLESIKNPSGEE